MIFAALDLITSPAFAYPKNAVIYTPVDDLSVNAHSTSLIFNENTDALDTARYAIQASSVMVAVETLSHSLRV